MAVQAHYPSNLLFHDRGEPEMDLPKQQQHQHQHHQLAGVSPAVYFASAGATVNRRKRGREAMAMAPPAPVKEEYISLFAQQSAPFFNMAQQQQQQLHSRVASSPSPAPATRVSTGLRLALDEQQQRQINSLCYPSSTSSSPFVSVADEFAGQMKRHGEELDKFIRDQGEQLRRAIADRMRHQNRALLAAVDKSAWRRLREKALEAEREARRGAELEERLARLRNEAAAWQAKTLSEQATAVTLHAQLQQAAAAARVSCEELTGGGDAGPAESSSSAYVDPRRTESDRACHACHLGAATVVLLPCRHLSLCRECLAAGEMDVALACPVCHCVRTGSVEAILC